MKIITAPELFSNLVDGPSVFLAGGITNCPWWQDELIALLDPLACTVLNPRRRNFPIHDPSAARQQIVWEYSALRVVDVFSMWFSNADSDQPICMYELGMHLALRAIRGDLSRVVIGVEPGYRREQDVRIQTALVSKELADRVSNSLRDHAQRIADALGIDYLASSSSEAR